MRIQWKKVVLLALGAGLVVLFLRGLIIARCSGEPLKTGYEGDLDITVYNHRE